MRSSFKMGKIMACLFDDGNYQTERENVMMKKRIDRTTSLIRKKK